MAELKSVPGLKSLIAHTRRRLRELALWRAWWPWIVLISVFFIAALLGIFEHAPKRIGAFASLLVIFGGVLAFVRGLKRYRSPKEDEAIKALDAQDELRPISSLMDRPISPGGEGYELWQKHQTRLTDAARRLRAPRFTSLWRQIDPLFLRYALPALLIAATLFANTNTYSHLKSALNPDYGSLFGAESIRIEAWITPPAYSGRAPIFLQSDQLDVRVPKGSVMTIRAQAPSAPKLRVKTSDLRDTSSFEATPDGAFEAITEIRGDAEISVRWWGERKVWNILASPDAPPTASFVELPVLGDNDRTEFTWAVSDDYGVTSLAFAIKPAGSNKQPDLVPVELGAISPKEAEDEVAIDFTRNRWAGARVDVHLIATDGAGQTGISEVHNFILPEKLLLQPLAKAVQDIRVSILREDGDYAEASIREDSLRAGAFYASATQRLGKAPAGIQRAAIMLDAVTYDAPRYFNDILIYSGLRSAQRMLEAASGTAQAKATEPLLWSIALRAEYGTAADALAALQAARRALEEALRDGASEEEIARLMQAFKDAAQRYLAARMAEAMANGLDAPPDDTDSAQSGGGPGLGGQDFSDMLDALEDLTETGASDQARQLLSDITNMLENLEFQQGNGSGSGFPGMPGEPGEGDDENMPEEEREMTETMRELSDLLREQRELNDETLAQQRGERGSEQGQFGGEMRQRDGEFSEEGGTPDRPGFMNGESEDERSLAERQGELGDLVEELARRNEEAGGGEGEEGEGGGGLLDEDLLEAIERAQRRAGSALEDGNEARAMRNQEQATRQLRELAEGLADQLDELQAARLGDENQMSNEGQADPFGNSSTGGVDDRNQVDIPDEVERQRARDILDELRQRYGDTPDEDEREYLERLLDRF